MDLSRARFNHRVWCASSYHGRRRVKFDHGLSCTKFDHGLFCVRELSLFRDVGGV